MKLSGLLGLSAWAGSALAADLLFYQGLTYKEYKQALALNYTGIPLSLSLSVCVYKSNRQSMLRRPPSGWL